MKHIKLYEQLNNNVDDEDPWGEDIDRNDRIKYLKDRISLLKDELKILENESQNISPKPTHIIPPRRQYYDDFNWLDHFDIDQRW